MYLIPALILVLAIIFFIWGRSTYNYSLKQRLYILALLTGFASVVTALFLTFPEARPSVTKYKDTYNLNAHNIQAHYEVTGMKYIEVLPTHKCIEVVFIQNEKIETMRFSINSSDDRIRITQGNNTVGLDANNNYHLYITQEDYNRILGYQ